jgi:flagellar motor switch protein FliG
MPDNIAIEKIGYDSLTKVQKLALFMVVIGPEVSSELLKGFEDSEIESICREISNFTIVDEETQRKVVEEFSDIISTSLGSILGGAKFAQRTLELAKGDYKAANLLSRIAPVGNSMEVIQEISDMEPRQIHNLIRSEQPQTIAFVTSHLSQEKAASLITMLTPDVGEEVVERIGAMEYTSLEHVGRVVGCLKKHFDTKHKPTMHSSGGVRSVADLLNLMDKETSKTLLVKLEERNPQLGMQIRRKMFSFEDLVRLEIADLQRVTRELEMSDLVIALKSSNLTLQEKILKSVSKRASESIKEEMEMLGPVRLKEVEAAQDRIIQVVRKLEEEGEITLDNGGENKLM